MLTMLQWPPRFGMESVVDRHARHVGSTATVICRSPAGSDPAADFPYDLRPFPSVPGSSVLPRAVELRGSWAQMVRVAPRSADIWHAHGLAAIPPALWLRRLRAGRVVATVHHVPFEGRLFDEALERSESRREARWIRRQRDLLTRCDAVIAIGPTMHTLLSSAVPSDKLHAVFNGVRTVDRVEAPDLARPDFVFIGRLKAEKGIGDVLEAWRLTREDRRGERLVICGEGPMRGEVEQAATRDASIDYLGWVDADQRTEILRRAAFGVLPSRVHEAMQLAGLEVLAAGRPLIGTTTGGSGDVQRAGKTGWTVEPAAPRELAEALRAARAVADDSRRWMDLARSSLAAAQPFSETVSLQRLDELYRSLV